MEAIPTLLLVDDKASNLRLLHAYLASEGWRLLYAGDGQEALDVFATERPDLVVLDVMMPGIDGFEVLRRLRLSDASVPVVLLTSLSDRESRIAGLRAGATDFLSKPVDRVEFVQRVTNMLRLSRLARSLDDKARELAAANAELDAFAGRVAHDIQQPMAAVLAFSRTLRTLCDSHPVAAEAEAMLQGMERSAERALGMAADLLEFARLGAAPLEPARAPLDEIVDHAWDAVRLEVASTDCVLEHLDLPVVRGDARLLELAFVNLFANAVKFTPAGQPATIRVDAAVQGSSCEIQVCDQGVGFPAAQAGRLFQPFQRLHGEKFPGSGLGLANVRRIVERHGGTVSGASPPSGGACFRITLPLWKD